MGWIYFKEPIVESIRSTPHPMLVYVIFGTASVVVLLVMLALWRYIREENFLLRLQSTPEAARYKRVAHSRSGYDLKSLFLAVFAPNRRENHEAVVQHEVHTADETLRGHLALPTYLNGALVGLGLVGTFVGLLDTLADMGALFSSMTQMTDKSADSTQLLSELLGRLQEPMRGMGTAFVASLYGLMSSLVLGLVLHSAKRSCHHVMAVAHELVRQASESYETLIPPVSCNKAAAIWAESVVAMRSQHQQALSLFAQFHNEVAQLGSRIEGLENQIALRNQYDSNRIADTQAALQPVVKVMSNLLEQQTASVHALHDLRSLLQNQTQSKSHPLQAKATEAVWTTYRLTGVVAIVVFASAGWLMHAAGTAHDDVKYIVAEPSNSHSEPPSLKPQAVEHSHASASEADSAHPSHVDATQKQLQIQVKEGDTLRCIATRSKVSLKALLALNPELRNPDFIVPKQWLAVPSSYQEDATCPRK